MVTFQENDIWDILSCKQKYMQRYIDEYIFRFNTRNFTDSQRFNLLLRNAA